MNLDINPVILWFIRNIYLILQVTKIYFLYIFDLPPLFLSQSSQSPWNFLSVESDKGIFCFINEVTFGKHLRMRAGLSQSPCDWRVGIFNPHPLTSCGGRGPESIANGQRFNQSWLCNEVSIKTQEEWVQRPSRLVNTWRFGESGWSFPYHLPSASLPSGSSWVIFFYNKLVIW